MNHRPDTDRLKAVTIYEPLEPERTYRPGQTCTNYTAGREMLVKAILLSPDGADVVVQWQDGTEDGYHNCPFVARYGKANEPGQAPGENDNPASAQPTGQEPIGQGEAQGRQGQEPPAGE